MVIEVDGGLQKPSGHTGAVSDKSRKNKTKKAPSLKRMRNY